MLGHAMAVCWGWHLCYGFVLAAAAGGSQLLEPGSTLNYNYEATLLLNEAGTESGKDVGFQISAQLSLETVWEAPSGTQNKLLYLKLMNPKLLVKSRKAPAPEGFIFHHSKLDELKNSPFLIHWKNGEVSSVYINQNEGVSLINLKKGIASLFQFRTSSQELKETDASGHCSVLYTVLDVNMFEKIKADCQVEAGLPFKKHPDEMWRADLFSKARTVITLSSDLSWVDSIVSEEQHEAMISLRTEVGGAIKSNQQITFTDRSAGTMLVRETSVDAAVKNIEKSTSSSFAKHSLTLTKENSICVDGTCPTFASLVKEFKDALKPENLGTTRSASAFIKLIDVARESKKEDLLKTLKNNKNKKILMPLLDVMGAAQTVASHEAAIQVLNFKNEDSLDLNERYLWSLSLGAHPLPHTIEDLLKLLSSGPYQEKLEDTIVLTIAAMTNKLNKHKKVENVKTVESVHQTLLSKLKACSNDVCHLRYVRGLKNLAAVQSIPTLLNYAKTGNKKVSVASINALHAFDKQYWTSEMTETAKKVYFQLDRRYDSSARTMALDILLSNDPDESLLRDILQTLQCQDKAFEVRQYLLQRLWQIGESDRQFLSKLKSLMRDLKLTNYHILGQKGLSTAFTRSFMNHQSANGTLSTVQEMSGGIVKRGLVDVIIDKNGLSQSVFTLGLFAGGLGSFLSSDDNTSEEEQDEEGAVAGMDLSVMGVQIRPFVFFSGQGELMGHVWSGTASDLTPAFQAISLLQDHLQFIPLQAGYIAELNLRGGISFDLSGQISISIWNRNAESLVEKSAGLSVMGLMRVNTMFVQSQVQFNVGTEVKLRLVSNIDFSNSIALCLQLQQPNSVIKHNVHKVERIPGSKHRLRKSKYRTITVPGRTYALNEKNNELCNVIFS